MRVAGGDGPDSYSSHPSQRGKENKGGDVTPGGIMYPSGIYRGYQDYRRGKHHRTTLNRSKGLSSEITSPYCQPQRGRRPAAEAKEDKQDISGGDTLFYQENQNPQGQAKERGGYQVLETVSFSC